MEELEMISFQMISTVGTARSMFVNAIQLAKEGKFEEARAKIKEGEDCFIEGHHAHANLLSKMAEGEHMPVDLLLVHAEDQMMSAETFKMVALELIEMYEKFLAK